MSTQTLESKKNRDAAPSPKLKRVVQPLIDLYESGEGFVLFANLPGVRPGHLEVTVEKKILTIRGLVNQPAKDGFRHVYSDRPVTEFVRRLRLSDEIDRDSIEAALSNGTLTLKLSKTAPAQKRTITIQSTGTA